MKTSIPPVLITFALVSFLLTQNTQAISPPPDGGYPGGNTAEGQAALLSLTAGAYNTAIGIYSLLSLTDGNFNTAIGAGTLLNATSDRNTAVGAGALLSNTSGAFNAANGAFALLNNTQGAGNTANGHQTLFSNTIGILNTANGDGALFNNTTGSGNTALGDGAGDNLTTGDNNIDIGSGVEGVAGESNTIRVGNTDITDTFVRGISGATVASGATVLVAANGHLGTVTSSKRFKEEIKSMDRASEAVFALKPVTFRYKKELDPAGIQQFGLVAEDVEKVSPDLVVRDESGKVNTVRYDQVNAMLLNEFLKAHQKMEEQGATIAQQQKQIEALTAGLQKVSAHLDLSKPAAQKAGNKQ